MHNIICNNGCCTINTSEYIHTDTEEEFTKEKSYKSGGLLYDNLKDSILIIQSRGNLWGIPKGTLEEGESYMDGSIREIYEETGLTINKDQMQQSIQVDDTCLYYFIPFAECNVDIQTHIKYNDANSIGWVKLKCLKEMIKQNKIKLTKHTKIILKKFLLFS